MKKNNSIINFLFHPGCCTCKGIAMLLLVFCIFSGARAQNKKAPPPLPPLSFTNNHLVYRADSLGNRIPDFSYAGYMASEKPIPGEVPVKVVVPVLAGDATNRIQSALDYVASLPMEANGFRGAVLLQKGSHEVLGQLNIHASGVVLRGSGIQATTIFAAGNNRFALIKIAGKNDKSVSRSIKITDPYVPVNALQFSVEDASGLQAGNTIIIHRPSTKEWIEQIGTSIFGGGLSSLGWKAGDRDLFFDRTITKVEGNTITIDAPVTTAIDGSIGGGTIALYQWNGRISNAGIENLRCVSAYDKKNLKDEDHRWNAINIENATDAWVRQVTFQHFAGSAVSVLETSKRITVEDCSSLQPVSEIAGQRRYTFLTTGQQTLFQRCYAENGYHDFATGYCAPGPNAFVQCESYLPFNFSGAIDSWSSGILFDVVNVDGNALRLGNRGQDANGAGWAAANSVLWNCTAARIDCYRPPNAQNWAFGCWSQFAGDGYWNESNNIIQPRSLFYAQLAERLNKNVESQAQVAFNPGEASSSPSVETAMALTKLAQKPAMQLKEWIELAGKRNPINTNNNNAPAIDQIGIKKQTTRPASPVMQIKNGWLVRGNTTVTGMRQSVPWWTGGIQGRDLQNAKPAITRFVPGRSGNGLTDNLDELTTSMISNHIIAMEQNYGLWYDRRRDDHQRVRRMDGEVWPPFYELPFARSGKDTAWDGLSKYDLTKYNPFYWNRLKQFADLADQKGLVLIHQHYFQHNIIEAGAHYADFPWRTANNINNTGFPEPPPYAGDKRIFLAEQFYDIKNPARQLLHKKYIRQCLDNFKDNNGVIQLVGEEFTGPLHFVEFWLDVIKAWERETGKRQLIGLSTTKDVQDAILNNPAYNSVVDIIDIRYWHYQADGKTYEPKGGQNLAPRQHARLLKPKKTSFEQVYRAVSEYRFKYPNKAVIYSGDNYPEFGWAVLLAGGSLPVLPETDRALLQAAATMKPIPPASPDQYTLSDGNAFITYVNSKLQLQKFAANKNYTLKWYDIKSGQLIKEETVRGNQLNDLTAPKLNVVVWIVPQAGNLSSTTESLQHLEAGGVLSHAKG